MSNFMSTKEASDYWSISERRIQKLCQEKRIEGVKRFGRSWMIPAYAEKPKDAREKNKKHSSDKRNNIDLYGNEIRILSQNEKATVYSIENKTGNGIVTYYNAFPGIELYYNDFHMSDGFVRRDVRSTDLIEINHCRQGRFECAFKSGGYAYLGEGDLAINILTNSKDAAYFPLAHYHGISIVINIPEAKKTINDILSIFEGIDINLDVIREKTIDNSGYVIMRATDMINHIFYELYNVPDNVREGYIKFKIVELLMFLSTTDMKYENEDKEYFPRNQVKKIKEIRGFLIENIDKRYTLSQLSKEFSISMTTMKKVFKGIYGAPILTYMREYRIQVAAQMLRNTDFSISQISENVGYENPAKFSEAFKNLLNISPSDYRKKNDF